MKVLGLYIGSKPSYSNSALLNIFQMPRSDDLLFVSNSLDLKILVQKTQSLFSCSLAYIACQRAMITVVIR